MCLRSMWQKKSGGSKKLINKRGVGAYWKELRGTCWHGWGMWKEWGGKIGYESVEANRGRGGPQRRRRDKVKELLMGRALREREGMAFARNKEAWGRMVYGRMYCRTSVSRSYPYKNIMLQELRSIIIHDRDGKTNKITWKKRYEGGKKSSCLWRRLKYKVIDVEM